jgi:hypothetical protein
VGDPGGGGSRVVDLDPDQLQAMRKTKPNSSDGWNLSESLNDGQAMTRDGRIVLHLREAVIDDGETILIGDVSTKRRSSYKPGDMVLTEKHYWHGQGGFGNHGGDDLMTTNKR